MSLPSPSAPYQSPPGTQAHRRRTGRRREPRIVDIETHPRRTVGLRVAADYLGMNERTVRARIESGLLEATRDGRCYRITLDALAEYAAGRAVPRSTP